MLLTRRVTRLTILAAYISYLSRSVFTMMSPSRLCALGLALAAAGCADTEDADPGAPPRGDLIDALSAPRSFSIESDASVIRVTATNHRAGGGKEVEFTVVDGTIAMRAEDDGALTISEMSLDLADITVSPALFPPDGLGLRKLSVQLDYPVVAFPAYASDGITATVETQVSTTLAWSAEFDSGNVYPLRSIELTDLPLRAELRLDGDEVSARLSAARTGEFWDWAGMFDLKDLVLELEAVAD